MANQYAKTSEVGIMHLVLRLISGIVVLGITAFLTPGFAINGIWPLIIGAIVLAVLDYVALRFLNLHASPFGRGISGFVLAAVIIYITKFFVPGYVVSFWGAILGALVYGIIDAVIPGKAM
ncbi:MAG: phage holin family protein [Bacillota bacterium]|nr:phage holin family protein [Bacillota bacterium]